LAKGAAVMTLSDIVYAVARRLGVEIIDVVDTNANGLCMYTTESPAAAESLAAKLRHVGVPAMTHMRGGRPTLVLADKRRQIYSIN
jgi:hypothetical protein